MAVLIYSKQQLLSVTLNNLQSVTPLLIEPYKLNFELLSIPSEGSKDTEYLLMLTFKSMHYYTGMISSIYTQEILSAPFGT